MDAREKRCLLQDLHLGRTSRNKEFGRFCEPQARAVLNAHRRLRSLLGELVDPGVRATVRALEDGRVQVTARRPALRYRRVLVLEPWEAEFLTETAPSGSFSPSI